MYRHEIPVRQGAMNHAHRITEIDAVVIFGHAHEKPGLHQLAQAQSQTNYRHCGNQCSDCTSMMPYVGTVSLP
jgi:hypothetical protein